MDTERQKKIEAGKLELAKFQRKRRKRTFENATSTTTSSNDDTNSSTYSESSTCDIMSEQVAIQETMTVSDHMKQPSDSVTCNEQLKQDSEHIKKNSDSELSNLKEIDDWSSTDDMQALQLYGHKIEKLQEAIGDRDKIIHQLTCRLEVTIESLNTFKYKDTQQEEMTREMENYKIQLQQAKELVSRQKNRTEPPVLDCLNSQTCDIGFQVNLNCPETQKQGSFTIQGQQTCPRCSQERQGFREIDQVPNEMSVELSKCTFEIGVQVDNFESPEFVIDGTAIENPSKRTVMTFPEEELFERYQAVLLENNDLQDKLTQLQQNAQSNVVFSKDTFTDCEREIEDSNRQSLVNSLKKVVAINNIGKILSSLLHNLNHSLGESTINQTNQFNLTHLTSTSSNGDKAEALHPNQLINPQWINDTLTSFNDDSSLEVFRDATLSGNLLSITNFLDQEMQANLLIVNSSQIKSDTINLMISGEPADIEIVNEHPLLCLQSDRYIHHAVQEKYVFDQSIQEINNWVNGFKESAIMSRTDFEENLTSEELPVSNLSLVTLEDNERLDILTEDAVTCSSDHISDLSKTSAPIAESLSVQQIHSISEELTATPSNSANDIPSVEFQDFMLSEFIGDMKSQCDCRFNHFEETLQSYYINMETCFLEKMEKIEDIKCTFKSQVIKMKNKYENETSGLLASMMGLEERLRTTASELSKCKEEKLDIQSTMNNQIADLVAEHNEDLENVKQNFYSSIQEKEKQHLAKLKELQEQREKEIEQSDCATEFRLRQKTQELNDEFHKSLTVSEHRHALEISKVETFFEEKNALINQSRRVYETVLNQKQVALHQLFQQIERQIYQHKDKLQLIKTDDSNMHYCITETLDELMCNIRTKFNTLFRQNDGFDDTAFRTEQKNAQFSSEIQKMSSMEQKYQVTSDSQTDHKCFIQDSQNIDGSHINHLLGELNNAKQQVLHHIDSYKDENNKLKEELKAVNSKLKKIEDYDAKLKQQLTEAEAKLHENSNDINSPSVRESLSSHMLSSNDVYNVAQTNSRLLHVLSDAVKTFLEIEQDIINRLREFGLTTGSSQGLFQLDDDTGQSVGSREDFSGIGESSILELHEDGPDLTPRTWNLMKTMGGYDADPEDEDVIIGTTRRVRLQIDHLLHLLSLVFDKTKEQDFKALLRRNEELSQELQEETQGRDHMQLNLVNAQSIIRKCEANKQKLQEDNSQLYADKESLSHEIDSLKLKISQMSDEKDRLYEENRLLQTQLDVLSSRLGDPEKMTSHNEHLSCHMPELLQENTKLSSEKLSIQKNLGREKHTLAARIQLLELNLDEMTTEREDILDRSLREKQDLQCQIDSLEKQLMSYKKFTNEQAAEREQEREDSIKEIKKLCDQLREKDKMQSIESQHSKDAESLENQLKAKIEEHSFIVNKNENLEKELRQYADKILDLRDVIAEAEKQLESKNRAFASLEQKLQNAVNLLSNRERLIEDMKMQLNQHSNVTLSDDLSEEIHNLKDQLASKSQEVDQLYQSDTLLKELRGQLHFLEAKVDQKAKHLDSMNLVSLTASPVLSDDASHCESHDGEQHQMQCEDAWEMSPRSVHWLEVRRLEEKICHLIQIAEELVKQNKDYCSQLKRLLCFEEEWCHEKAALQKQNTDQLLQVTALKTRIEEMRHWAQPRTSSLPLTEMEKLRDAYEDQQEQRKKACNEVMDLKHEVHELKNIILDKEHLIQKLQTNSQVQQVVCNKPVQTEMPKSSEIVTSTPKAEPVISALWQNLLQEKSLKIDSLSQELAEARSQLKKKELSEIDGNKVSQLYESSMDLQQKLFRTEMELAASKEEVSSLLKRIVELESALQQNREELQLEQVQLEKDFDTVQDMMHKKEKELSVLQEETENQMRLEAANDSLQQQLMQQTMTNEDLCEKLTAVEEELVQEKLVHSSDVEKLQKKIEESIKHYESKLEQLRGHITLLKSDFSFNEDFNDVEIKAIQEKIVNAALKLQNTDQESISLFQEIVYRILQQAVELKTNSLKQYYDTKLDNVQKTWCQKLTDAEGISKSSMCDAIKNYETEKIKLKEDADLAVRLLQQKFDMNLKNLSEEKDNFWKDKMDTMKKTWAEEKDNLKCSMKDKYQSNEDVSNKIDELKQSYQKLHIEETCKLKEIIAKVSDDKNKNEELMKSLHEKEKLVLLKECENKIVSIAQQLKEMFNKEKLDLEKQHGLEIVQLKKLISEIEIEKEEINRKHQEELNHVRLFFSKKWISEIQKLQQMHKNELQALKDSGEKGKEDVVQYFSTLYENKFKSIQAECEVQLIDEKQRYAQQHEEEINRLHKMYEKQKEEAIAHREQQLTIKFQQKYDKEFLDQLQVRELQKFEKDLKVLEEKLQKKNASNERKLKSTYQKELLAVKQNFEAQLISQKNAHEEYLRLVKEQYGDQLQNAQEIIRALKEANVAVPKSSLSDITSSDDTCSSNNCGESKVLKKIHGYSVKTLALSENLSQKREDDMIQLRSLCELKSWIVERLKEVIFVSSDPHVIDIKLLIEKLIEEVKLARKNANDISNYKMSLREEIEHCRRQYTVANSELLQKVNIQAQKIALLESRLPQTNGNTRPEEDLQNNVNYTLDSEEHHNGTSMENPRAMSFYRSDFLSEGPLIAEPHLKNRHNLKKLQWIQRRDRRRIVALIFQKKYLSTLLSAFQATEEITIAMLAQMGVSISNQRSLESDEDKPKGISRFRSVIYVVIALCRMKHLAAQCQRDLANFSSPPSIRRAAEPNKEAYYKSIFINPDLAVSSTSVSTCSGEDFCIDRQPRYRKSNSENLPNNQLIQYVNRLEVLHRQLGLDDQQS